MSNEIDWFGRGLMRSSGYGNGEIWKTYDDVRLLEGLDDEEFEDVNEELSQQELWQITKGMPLPSHLEFLEGHTVWIYSTPEAGIVQMRQIDGDEQTGHAGQVTVSLWRTDHWAEFFTHHHYDGAALHEMATHDWHSTSEQHKQPTYNRLDRLALARVRFEAWERVTQLLTLAAPAPVVQQP